MIVGMIVGGVVAGGVVAAVGCVRLVRVAVDSLVGGGE